MMKDYYERRLKTLSSQLRLLREGAVTETKRLLDMFNDRPTYGQVKILAKELNEIMNVISEAEQEFEQIHKDYEDIENENKRKNN